MVTETAGQSDGNTAFLRAARAGNLDKVLEYLKSNIDINTSNANGLNALHLASKDGHVHVVTELLRRGATVDAATKKGNTALHIASLAGQEDVVKILVQHEASVNVQSQNGFTPLYMAAQENHDNVVRFLLANGANQSLATEDGFTPLAVAMQQGHDKVVAVLLENDTRGKVRLPALHIAAKKDDCKAAALLLQNDHNPDVTSKSGFTPLHIAAHYGNENIANLLLQRGADVNYSAKHNITPLHVAAKWGKTNMVSLLIEKGANIEAKTRDGLTPLHCAARSGHEQVVDMLLERGAPISSKTKNGLAPLHMASQGDHVDAARILLYHKAPVDEVTVDYLTALHVAAHCGHVRVAKLLLDRKADPNARALNGFTPLHIACKKNRIKVVELLLKHGASIEATTESGLTPLHVASFMGCMNIVIYLIQHEANPDVPTVRGETPLHLAARANQTDIIRILLRNGAQVDARAREQQTPLHIASRLGNVDIVMLLLQHGAAVDATTKDMYTALHIAAKEGQEEVASVLLENGASLTATTKKGFTPLHLAAKYGNMKVAKLLLQRDAPVDAQGKNGVTPLHVASHYDHQNVALLLLDKGASPHATAKNGHTPLHIAARKNQMDIATTLLEYGAKANAESKAGFTPLHLSAQEGHTDMSTLLIEHQADPNHKSKNGLSPLHLCAQEDRVNVASILVKNGAEVDAKTKAGYTPLHVASHFGQLNMVRFLLQHGVDVNSSTSAGYTPLHQAAQQGHTLIINLLLENKAAPNAVTNQGQTALSIAQKLGYISVVETLKVVTETVITTTTTTIVEEKYRVMAPETMQETFMSDSEDEGGEDTMLSDQPYRYLTVDEMKSLGDDSLPIDVTRDERGDSNRDSMAIDDSVSPVHVKDHYVAQHTANYAPDNVDIARHPVHVGKLQWKTFLVSFMVDARGGAMRGCRHSGVRVIVPPRKAAMPMRITCRYLKKDKLTHPPPLMEGEALASRILELGPVGAKFLGPVIIEVPHFGSLRGKEREIVILRSDNGETWREHTLEASEEAIQDVLQESFDGEDLNQLEDLNTNRITRILTTDFPQYFAIVSRVRQEVHAIGPEGGMVSSSVVPQVQAVFPQGALTKKIKVGLQAQPIPSELVAKMLGNRVAVSPIVTVEPRRRKFHKPITLTIPVPQAANKGMINQYSGDAPTLRLLCSITGGTTRAQWEDVTGSTPLTFVNDCVSFTTTVSARFWLMDCRNIGEATRMATELYKEAIHVPFMAKFVVFAKRIDLLEARLRVFCMTDDKEDKTLEHQEHFQEMAKSRDVEVLEGKTQYVEFNGNLVPVTKSGDQLQLGFHAFKENRLPFTVRVKDPHADTVGRVLFMREPKVPKGEAQQTPICVLNIVLPENITPETMPSESDVLELEKKYTFLREGGLTHPDSIHRADLRLSDICNLLGNDWVPLANELGVSSADINLVTSKYPDSVPQQAMVMLRLWMQQASNRATGNTLGKALRKIGRDDIVNQCICNVELVTDDMEKAVAKVHLDQSGFENLKEELGPSRDTSLRRNISLDATYDEQDMMRDSESVEELVASEKIVPIKEEKRLKESPERERRSDKIEVAPSETTHVYELEEHKYVAEEKHYVEPEQHSHENQLLQEITDEFVRIDTAQKSKLGENEELASSRISKTPPPSPAEFKDETVTVEPASLERQDFPARETVVHEQQAQFVSPDGTHVRQTIITTTTVTQGAEPSVMEAALLAESETWKSDDMDPSARAESLSSAQGREERFESDNQIGFEEGRLSGQADMLDERTTVLLNTMQSHDQLSLSQPCSSRSDTFKDKQIKEHVTKESSIEHSVADVLLNENVNGIYSTSDDISSVSYSHKKQFWEQISKNDPDILDQRKAHERNLKTCLKSELAIKVDDEFRSSDQKISELPQDSFKFDGTDQLVGTSDTFPSNLGEEIAEEDNTSVTVLRKKFETHSSIKNTEIKRMKSIESEEQKNSFETIIRNEILEQQMLQQPEEGSPERKEISRSSANIKDVSVNKEQIVSRHIHTHIFSNELDENIEQLFPEDKDIRPSQDTNDQDEDREEEPQTSGYFSDIQKETIHSSSMDDDDSGSKSIKDKIGAFERMMADEETKVIFPFGKKSYIERKKELSLEENIARSSVSDKNLLNESTDMSQPHIPDSHSTKLELNLVEKFVKSNDGNDDETDCKEIKCTENLNITTDVCNKKDMLTPEEVRCIAIEIVNEIEKRVELQNTTVELSNNIQPTNIQHELHSVDVCSTTDGDKINTYLYESVGIENFPATDSGVEKTIAVVRESLEAAQETLIEEQKKSKGNENFADKKRSPSEFEFKISQFDKMNKMDQFILEENADEILTAGQLSEQSLKDQNLEFLSQDVKDTANVKLNVNTSDDSEKDDAKSSNGGTAASEDYTTSSLSHEKNVKKLPQRREIEKIIETETPVVLRRKKQIHRLDGDSSSSSREVSLRVDRKSGADFDLCSSSGESHYHSFDDNVRTNSRPCSSDVEAFMLGTATSSEYESALTSQEHSQRSTTSQEYHTAVSSLSSRESMKSLDSESSGHLASIEVSSEASETLIPSAMELEKDMEEIDTPMQDEIAIRCEPNEIRTAEYEYLTGDSSEQDEVENIINMESRVNPENLIGALHKDEYVDDTINNDFSDAEEDTNMPITDDDTSLTERPKMKRSLEMTFHPEPKPILTGSPISDNQFTGDDSEKLVSSYEDGILSASISEQGMKTAIENLSQSNEQLDLSRQSDRSFSSDILNNLTTSNTSASVSSESKDDIQSIVDVREISSFDIGITTDLTDSDQAKFDTNSVTLLTSTVSVSGIYNASTQVTSIKDLKEDASMESDCEARRNKKSFEIGHRRSESFISQTLQDVVKEEYVTTKKEQQDIEKKDIDESEPDIDIHKFKKSYIRETKYSDTDTKEFEDFDVQDTELKDLVDSRPTSKADSNISKSDSENIRPFSSAFSDDHPDSEINELLRHCSSVDKDTDDPIERPKTPEPTDCVDLLGDEQEDSSVFSEEVVTHTNEILTKSEDSVIDKFSASKIKDHGTEDVREADIAFHLINRTTPTFPSLQDTIPEDESEEYIEECTSEQRNLSSGPNNDLHSNYIPDITVTQHMTPLKDSGFHYPDLELRDESIDEEKDEKSTPQTPASMSSHVSEKSSETETDQGREYIVSDELAILDSETDGTGAIDIIPENANEDNLRDSPDTDSFEMLDKNEIEKAEISDIKNEFVIVEEIGKEADEHCEIAAFPQSIPTTRGVKIKKKVKSKDDIDDDDDLLVSSPPPTSARLTEVKYYPEEEKTEEGQFKIDTDSPPETQTKSAKCISSVMQEYQRDVEEGKKWIEMQFQGSEHPYGYDVEYERGHLEDIEERREEEEMVDAEPSRTSSKVGSLGSYKDSFSSTPEYDVLAGKKYFTRSGEHDDVSMSSLQEFERLEREIGIESNRRQSSSGSQDSLNGSLPKRQFGKSGQGDDISLSSLKEFERLEIACIQAEKIEIKAKEEEALLSEIDEGHESQVSESESCETISEAGKESDSDDYEKRMFEIDEIIRQAQCNVEQFEKESGTMHVKFKHDLKSKKMGNIMKEILKQSSAEDTESNLIEKTEGKSEPDSLEDIHIPEIEMDISVAQSDYDILQNSNQVNNETECSVSNALTSFKNQHDDSKREQHPSDDEHDSLQDDFTGVSVPTMQASTDSLDLKTVTQSDCIMTASIDSIEFQQSSQQRDVMVTSVDSIELAAKQMTISCDSLDSGAVTSSVLKKSGSVDSIEEEAKGSISGCQTKSSSSGREGDLSSSGKDDSCDKDIAKYGSDIMICSTDSLEPSSSTATHATYQYETDSVMSSSFTSGGSATMMSSTDTLDPELKISSPTERFNEVRQLLEAQAAGAAIPGVFDDDGNFQPDGGESHTFTDFDGNLRTVIHYTNLKQTTKPYVTEVIEPMYRDTTSEKNKDVCSSTIPQLQKELCSDADKLAKSNVKKYYTDGRILEYEDISSVEKFGMGDLSQRGVTLCSQGGVDGVDKTTLTAIDVHIFDNKSGEKIDTNLLPECSIVRMDPRSCSTEIAQSTYITRNIITQHVPTSNPPFPNIQQTILSSQPGITSELTGVPASSERTEDEAHGDVPIRVSSSDSCRPVRAVSIDDDSENVEVDLREHDWRFDLQALHEESQGMIHDSGVVSAGLEIVGGEPTTHRRVVTTQTRTTIGPDGEPVTVTETTETTTEEAAASLASLSRHSPDHFVERN